MANEFDKTKLEDIIDKKLNEVADFLFSTSQENIVQMKAIDEGTMLKSGYVQRNRLEKTVGYSAPYSGDVEYGTEPHYINPEVLEGWAHRKLGVSKKEAKRVAYFVSKSIAKNGTEPKPFFRDAIAATKAKYRKGIIIGA